MTTYRFNVSASVTLDRSPSEHEARALGQRVVEGISNGVLLMVSVHGTRFGVAAESSTDVDVPPWTASDDLADAVLDATTMSGYRIESWEALEMLSPAEASRRLEAAALPPMVSTAEFAQMCGVSTQRMYELETARKKAAAVGKSHELPSPVVPGWYLKAAAERYAATRKRKPGPSPRVGDDPFADPW